MGKRDTHKKAIGKKEWKKVYGYVFSREQGNVGNIMITGLCMLAMTVVMLSYMDNVQLVQQKTEINQLARKYILRMETVGYLTPEDRSMLTQELQSVGVTEITYEGTTEHAVGYGQMIALQIKGKVKGQYDVAEQRVSTAKN